MSRSGSVARVHAHGGHDRNLRVGGHPGIQHPGGDRGIKGEQVGWTRLSAGMRSPTKTASCALARVLRITMRWRSAAARRSRSSREAALARARSSSAGGRAGLVAQRGGVARGVRAGAAELLVAFAILAS